MPQLDIIIFSSEYIWLIIFISIVYNLINLVLITNLNIYFLIEKFFKLVQIKQIMLYTKINLLKLNIINIYIFFNDFILNFLELINLIIIFYLRYFNFFILKKQIGFPLIKPIFIFLMNFFKNYNYIYLVASCVKNKN